MGIKLKKRDRKNTKVICYKFQVVLRSLDDGFNQFYCFGFGYCSS